VSNCPTITVDGPTASGKGTVAQRVAQSLDFHYLDSGALYRLVALAALESGVDLRQPAQLAGLAERLDLLFKGGRIYLNGRDVSDSVRAEQVGNAASAIAVFPAVRAALFERQRACRRPPGLVADGRDMGTIVFSDADLKIFLTASAEKRAQRRYKQLIEKGFSASITTLLRDLQERDARDAERSTAPLMPAADAVVIDSSELSVDGVVERILELAAQRGMGKL